MELSLGIAFIAGIISFLSPCILPIVPGFLAYLAGTTVADASGQRRQVFLNALIFVLGFSAVFAVLGVVLNTVLSTVAYDARIWLSRVGGVLIIIFGLYLTKLIRLPFLEREYKFRVAGTGIRSRYVTSFLFGAAFAAGWTPCVGAVLGGILTLAVTQPGSAFFLLMSYALGLGIPFLLVGLFAAGAQRFIARYARAMEYLTVVFGVVLIVLGILVFTLRLERVASFELLNRFLLTQ
ncbi:MAG TPA: cytochrome c biogenesis protein CcdA [Candidatus Paceibacterota bacterium]|nr:cytochrome c biogenesis protein CcdA [Candidatus Paceibacterota bacterium]